MTSSTKAAARATVEALGDGARRLPRAEKLTFGRRRSGYYFKEPEGGIERIFRHGSAWDPTPQKVRDWLSMCKSRDAKTRHEGLFALRRSGALSPRVVDLASEALRERARRREEVRERGTHARARARRPLWPLTRSLDPNDDLSGSEIVRALRELGDRSALPPLRELLGQIVAARDGSRIADLPGERAHYALTVVDAMLALGARQEREILLEFLDHQDDVIRSLALSILHDRAGPWSRPALRKILGSRSPFYRRVVAAEALCAMGDRVAQQFIEAAAVSPRAEERRRAVPALALRHTPRDLDLLEAIWRREPLWEEKLALGVELLERGRLDFRRVFWGPLNHPYPHVRLRAVRLCLASTAEGARRILALGMRDEPDPFILAEAGRPALAAPRSRAPARA